MKPLKLFACLVTLSLTSGLTLKAIEVNDFREWTDDKGRQISARLIDMPDAVSVKIERQDGRVFTIPLKTFSETDQAYAKACYAKQKRKTAPENASQDALAEANDSTWKLLNSTGNQPASNYQNTGLDTIITGINARFTARGVKTATGESLQIRTEPSDLAFQVKVTGDIPQMNMALFLKQIAGINQLAVKTDPSGMIVLVDTTTPAPESKSRPGSVFGTTTDPR